MVAVMQHSGREPGINSLDMLSAFDAWAIRSVAPDAWLHRTVARFIDAASFHIGEVEMRASCLWRLWLTGTLLVAAAPMLQAEPPANLTFEGMIGKKPPKPTTPDVRAPPIVWPRLEAGAVVCRTEADLLRRAAAMRGEGNGPADCRVIGALTGIQIVARHGPGRTEVRLSGHSNEPAWTDAWLPANPPPGATAASAR